MIEGGMPSSDRRNGQKLPGGHANLSKFCSGEKRFNKVVEKRLL
jgi:hypothetical protein